ncbi:MAG: hypothetical protein JEY99_05690 [Spirochaetales bacterium]|nr:hypothetical protein [Spirochaetales bacterium]
MNRLKLKAAEKSFLTRYPGGFSHPDMVTISKKHKPEKMQSMAQEFFAPDQFENSDTVIEHMIKVVSTSSMVSVFEKPKFRDVARGLGEDEKMGLSRGLYEFLHGDEETGFEIMVEILQLHKLAKWTLITVYGAYYNPEREVFVKPTTVKGIIKNFEIPDLIYKPIPTYDFYNKYRDVINEMKGLVDPALRPGNAAFSGFLMMSMED